MESNNYEQAKAGAMALSLCLQTEALADLWIWNSDAPMRDATGSERLLARAAVLETLINALPFPASLTERRRILESLLPIEDEAIRRSDLMMNAVSELIHFVGTSPSVRLHQFRK